MLHFITCGHCNNVQHRLLIIQAPLGKMSEKSIRIRRATKNALYNTLQYTTYYNIQHITIYNTLQYTTHYNIQHITIYNKLQSIYNTLQYIQQITIYNTLQYTTHYNIQHITIYTKNYNIQHITIYNKLQYTTHYNISYSGFLSRIRTFAKLNSSDT